MFLPTLFFLFATLSAQSAPLDSLFAKFKAAAAFDYHYPRERVSLHLDNNAYFEGDTIWFKAYVMRASVLVPTNLSRVLYAELLDDNGRLRERKLLRIDSLGQANGEFSLALPIRSGFYEVRAYTREMLNWGEEACYSRVVPVFQKPAADLLKSDHVTEALFISRPEVENDLAPGHPRPFDLEKAHEPLLEFFPEGGNRVGGVAQRIAYRLTSRRGQPLSDSLFVYTAGDTLLLSCETEHEGMGTFTLPPGCSSGYVIVGKGKTTTRFPLPAIEARERYALSARSETDGVVVSTQSAGDSELLGLAVMCRERMCYFDTLTVNVEGVEILIPWTSLRDGVNRIELFDKTGRGLCRRLVWKTPSADRSLRLDVRQNEKEYAPFSPIALEMRLTDKDSLPVGTVLSLSVRDDGGELVSAEAESYSRLLLSSEVRGYIHHPEFYFRSDDARSRRALDLLLMVQGWTANSFSVMSGSTPFRLTQPIEDRLTLNGTVYAHNKKTKPRAGMRLSVKMYSLQGASLSGEAVTDSAGNFAFASNVDYTGEWLAQVTTRNENDRKKWSTVAFDRWFSVAPRRFDFREMTANPVRRAPQMLSAAETFVWRDTIPRIMRQNLAEVKILGRKYKGFTGNRFSYNGGEKTLKRYADLFYDIEAEVERKKDQGEATSDVWQLLAELNPQFHVEMIGETGINYSLYYRNLPLGTARFFWAEEVKSAAFMERRNRSLDEYHGVDTHTNFGTTETGIDYHHTAVEGIGEGAADATAQAQRRAEEATAPQGGLGEAGSVALHRYLSPNQETGLMIFERPDLYRFKEKRGIDKRKIYGYAVPKKFYSPNYRRYYLPTDSDMRRTLYWNPSLTTDAAGRATAVFFSNSRFGQRLRISARALTPDGRFLFFER